MAEIQFIDDAIKDLEALDPGALRLVLGKMRMLFENPEAGHPLGSRRTGNLTGFRKLVVGNRAYRIVYRIEESGSVCVMWVIAGRVDEECYTTTLERLRKLGDEKPVARSLVAVLEKLPPKTAQTFDSRLIQIRPDRFEGTDPGVL